MHGVCNNSFNQITENTSLPGEPGLLISPVNAKNPFFGYAGNRKQTEKKLLCDVFKKGDVYFNTGDLMVQDQENFLYFWDRIGDTFRYEIASVAKLAPWLWTLLWVRLCGNIHHLLPTFRERRAFISVMSTSLKIHCPSVSRLKHKLHFDVIFVIILTNLLGPNQWAPFF